MLNGDQFVGETRFGSSKSHISYTKFVVVNSAGLKWVFNPLKIVLQGRKMRMRYSPWFYLRISINMVGYVKNDEFFWPLFMGKF